MLNIKNLSVSYDRGLSVIKDLSLNIGANEIFAIIGINGAGKTTLVKTICGLLKPSAGTVIFNGEDISKRSPQSIVSRGVSCVPERRHLFPHMTVQENIELGAYCYNGNIKDRLAMVYDYFPILAERKKQNAGTLSGGEQQMAAIARALVAKPSLLIIDEPSLGLAPLIIARIGHIIKDLNNKEGMTILLVEQNVNLAFSLANQVLVLESGQSALVGFAEELAKNDFARKNYFGEAV